MVSGDWLSARGSSLDGSMEEKESNWNGKSLAYETR